MGEAELPWANRKLRLREGGQSSAPTVFAKRLLLCLSSFRSHSPSSIKSDSGDTLPSRHHNTYTLESSFLIPQFLVTNSPSFLSTSGSRFALEPRGRRTRRDSPIPSELTSFPSYFPRPGFLTPRSTKSRISCEFWLALTPSP